jgi:hypothetical protein
MQRRRRGCRGDSSVADHSLLLRSLVNGGMSSLHHRRWRRYCSGRACSGWLPLHMDNVIPLPLLLQGGGSCGHASSHGECDLGRWRREMRERQGQSIGMQRLPPRQAAGRRGPWRREGGAGRAGAEISLPPNACEKYKPCSVSPRNPGLYRFSRGF